MEKKRLDTLVVVKGLATSREKAKALIMARDVLVNGQIVSIPSELVAASAEIRLRDTLPFVSRGGQKLEHALRQFKLDVTGLVILDVGASTGGFTDCLLKHAAARVYAVDVGYGQLAWELRNDPRVVVLDRTNIRNLESLPEFCDAAVLDVSFISLRLVLRRVMSLTKPGAWLVPLIKPQFEAGRGKVGKGGVVRDPSVHREVLRDVLGWSRANGLSIQGLTESPLLGPAGNKEYLACLRKIDTAKVTDPAAVGDVEALIDQAVFQQSRSELGLEQS